jgi:transposase-like protein
VDGVEEKGGVPSRLIKTDAGESRQEGTPMTNVRTLPVGEGNEETTLALDQLAREGARRMIAAALRAEADEYVERFNDERDEDGHRVVVRNGRARERKVTVGSGTIPVRAPRVNDKRVDEEGGRQKFSSRILPAYTRRSPKVGEVIPILYLRGLSTGDFRPALEGLFGEDAAGLSAATVSRLCKLDRDWTPLTAFYDYPAEHWRHLRTTNPIESSFATVRLRTRVTKGAGSKAAALAMA